MVDKEDIELLGTITTVVANAIVIITAIIKAIEKLCNIFFKPSKHDKK